MICFYLSLLNIIILMATTTWSYLANVFNNVTKKSFRLMFMLAKDHLDKLAKNIGDPDIANLHAMVLADYTAFLNAMNEVQSNFFTYQMHTKMVQDMLTELSNLKVRQWDIAIQGVYLDNTPQYLDLMANGRAPFQRGSYDEKINAILVLANKLGKYPALATLQTSVQAYYDQIVAARSAQQGVEYDDTNLRKLLEKQRFTLATTLHKVFGFLIYKYGDDISLVESYYELRYLRDSSSGNKAITLTPYTISANSQITLYNGQLAADSYLSFKNTGTVSLQVFTSNDPNASVPPNVTEITAGETKDGIYADILSDGNGFNWLIVVNPNGIDGKVEIGKE